MDVIYVRKYLRRNCYLKKSVRNIFELSLTVAKISNFFSGIFND